jgi:hypothetical protein
MGHKVYAPNVAKNVTAKLDTRVILDFLLHLINFLWRLLHGINTHTSLYVSGGQQAMASESTKMRHTRVGLRSWRIPYYGILDLAVKRKINLVTCTGLAFSSQADSGVCRHPLTR